MTERRLTYQPALDGLRGLAVAMVLLFHGQVSWMSGGYVGVSIFFTLSGYLITSLAVRELDTSGRMAIGAFYARRARRLLPASMVCLALVVLGGRLGWFTGVTDLRRDAVGALFQVANWEQLLSPGSYADLFTSGSPLDHYWSLAVEEQFYWIWPLAITGAAWWVARRRARSAMPGRFHASMTRTIGWWAAASAAVAPLVAIVWGPDAAYWATPARASEILIGAWLGSWMFERDRRPSSDRVDWSERRPPRWLGPVAIGVLVLFAVTQPAASGLIYDGFGPLVAALSATLILSLSVPSMLTRVLSSRPFVAVGAVSYGVYLYHLPVYAVLTPARTGLAFWPLLGARLAVTGLLAVVSYRLVEQPIRRSTWTPRRTLVSSMVAFPVALVVVLVAPTTQVFYYQASAEDASAAAIDVGGSVAPLAPLAPVATASTTVADTTAVVGTDVPTATELVPTTDASAAPAGSDNTVDIGETADTIDGASTTPVAPTTTAGQIVVPSRPVRVLVMGDSTAVALSAGLIDWANEHPAFLQVSSLASPGCGLLRGGEFIDNDGPMLPHCEEVHETDFPQAMSELQPDVVVVFVTISDVTTRKWDGRSFLQSTAPEFEQRLRTDYRAFFDEITTGSAAKVVWVRPPTTDGFWLGRLDPSFTNGSQELIQGLVTEISDDEPGRVAISDLRGWMEGLGIEDDHSLRDDGIHLNRQGADLAADWMSPSLVQIALSGTDAG